MKSNKIWFIRKTYGYGWTPATWEGWLTLLVWLVIFIPITLTIGRNWIVGIIGVFSITGLLLYVCYKKGEKPRWQWGRKEDINN